MTSKMLYSMNLSQARHSDPPTPSHAQSRRRQIVRQCLGMTASRSPGLSVRRCPYPGAGRCRCRCPAKSSSTGRNVCLETVNYLPTNLATNINLTNKKMENTNLIKSENMSFLKKPWFQRI